MLLPENIEGKLQFDKIRQAVTSFCLTGIGAELTQAMTFADDQTLVELMAQRTQQMIEVLSDYDDFPAAEHPDIRESLKRIRIEGLYLAEEELLSLLVILRTSDAMLSFFAQTPDDELLALKDLAQELTPFPLIAKAIDRILDPHGTIRDNASPQLADIRHQIKVQEVEANRRLNAIMRRAQAEGLVDPDASIAIRDGVAAIPVVAANKRSLDGIVVDESATGRTAFIQPAEVVAINSRLRELHNEERREIIKILKEISSNIRPYAPDIIHSAEVLGQLDFLRAKALYADKIHGIVPRIDPEPGLFLSGARHPILMEQLATQGKSVVPLNVELVAPQSRMLVISGPNAGGKSVCLQTVGLLQYMFQCGLPIPAHEESRLCVFRNLFIDIGDNQSMDNDLSTYSSHLLAMKNFLRGADERTLLLIDEFGTGTEPLLGGAIAQSVLAELNNKQAFGVLTTHYTNLKHFASQTPGLVNGAMTFDVHKIEPLFTLHIGQPGSSFAFEIARKIGLPEQILQNAKEQMGQDNAEYDRNLRQIVRDKHYWEQKRQNVKENDKKLADVLQRYNDMLEGAKAERKAIIAKAKAEANDLLAAANKQIENTIRQIKESQAEKERTKQARQQFDEFRAQAEQQTNENDADIDRKIEQIKRRQQRQKDRQRDKAANPSDAATSAPQKEVPEAPIAVGDMVCIDGDTNRVAQIVALKANEATISLGSLVSTIKLQRLKRVSRSAAKQNATGRKVGIDYSNVAQTVREKKLNFKSEIDVRGMRADEALAQVGQLVDEAIMCEAPQIRILHGKGNGILRVQIQQYLNSIPFIANVHDEDVRFGGAGITVAEFN